MLPVTIEAAELSQPSPPALRNPMISSGATGYDQKVWESLTHFYEVRRLAAAQLTIMVNNDVWNDVSEEKQNPSYQPCAAMRKHAGCKLQGLYTVHL